MWVVSGGLVAYSAKKVREEADDSRIPLMGVLGAFVFAVQMMNFTIPGTGSSGHVVGAILLSILLGPYAAFLVLASVLTVQALFFADGGLLALGCNMFNMGAVACFAAYPLVYRPIAGAGRNKERLLVGAAAAGVAVLGLGAFCVVLETVVSGVSALPLRTFVLLLVPLHLLIGLGEGLITAGVVSFVLKARPELLAASRRSRLAVSVRGVALTFLAAAVLTGGAFSWFASSRPEGMERAVLRVSGGTLPARPGPLHALSASVQRVTSFLPDYGFRRPERGLPAGAPPPSPDASWPAVDTGTSVSGLVGGVLTLLLAGFAGLLLRRRAPAPGN
jgi:cobalt/nickel transport system permease protein